MRVGTVLEIWRYPVKSMAGAQLDAVAVGPLGVPGDRGWALRDEEAREVRGAKNFPALLRCAARYVEEPSDDRIPPPEITLPDGERVRSDEPRAAERLSALLGRRVTLWPRQPADDLEHYRRRLSDDRQARLEELRAMFGRLPEEPMPDFSVFPRELIEFTSPRGTYFDAFPLHVVTTAALEELGRRNPKGTFDRRRFRPNLFVRTEPGLSGLVEHDWSGRELRIGGARLSVRMPVVRCSMTIQPQEGLSQDPSVLRTIVRDAGQNLGIYATVAQPGTVRAGDAVDIL